MRGATPLLCAGCFQGPLSCRQMWAGMLNRDVGAGTPHGSHCSLSLSKPGWMEQQLLSSDERQSVKEFTGCA